MALWNDFLHGALPYQELWLPLAIGLAAGMLCLFMGSLVWRGKRCKLATSAATRVSNHDPFEQGSLSEKRKSLRRPGNPVEILYALPDNKNTPQRALVLDRSLGGLRLAADEQMEPGTRLVVLPINAVGQIPWIDIDVRTCTLVEDCWELGCQFVKTPQWSILLMFG